LADENGQRFKRLNVAAALNNSAATQRGPRHIPGTFHPTRSWRTFEVLRLIREMMAGFDVAGAVHEAAEDPV